MPNNDAVSVDLMPQGIKGNKFAFDFFVVADATGATVHTGRVEVDTVPNLLDMSGAAIKLARLDYMRTYFDDEGGTEDAKI